MPAKAASSEPARSIALQPASTSTAAKRAGRHPRRSNRRKIGREPGQENSLQAALAQVTSQTGRRAPIVFKERGVGIDFGAKPFADHQFGSLGCQLRMKSRARRALDAMIRPEGLFGHTAYGWCQKGAEPGCDVAKEPWRDGCQSCVSATWLKTPHEAIDRPARPHRRRQPQARRRHRNRSAHQ